MCPVVLCFADGGCSMLPSQRMMHAQVCGFVASTISGGRSEERAAVQGPAKRQHPDGPHAHRNTARQVVDDQNAEGSGQHGVRGGAGGRRAGVPGTPTDNPQKDPLVARIIVNTHTRGLKQKSYPLGVWSRRPGLWGWMGEVRGPKIF